MPRRSPPASWPASSTASSNAREFLLAGGLEDFRHGGDHLFTREDVAQADVTRTGHVPRPLLAFVTGEGRRRTVDVHHADLPGLPAGIRFDQAFEGVDGADVPFEQVESPGTEGRVGPGLRGDGAGR